MTFQVSSNEIPNLERSFRGYWHHQETPQPISGVLTFSRETGLHLDLNGTLLYPESSLGAKQVFGRAVDGTKLTLEDGHYNSQKAPWFSESDEIGPKVVQETWSGWALVVGAWLPDGGNTGVRQIRYRSPMLRAWTTWLRPKYEPLREGGSIGGLIETVPPISTAIPGGTITFQWVEMQSYSRNGGSIKLVPELKIVFDSEITIDDAWSRSIVPLLQFLTFCVGTGDSLESVFMHTSMEPDAEVYEPARDSYGWPLTEGWFEWCTTSWMSRPNPQESPSSHRFICPAPDEPDELARLLREWFVRYEQLKPALFDFLTIKMWSQMTAEESFYRVVRSLEVVHGLLDPEPHIPSSDFRRIKGKIKDALEGEAYREFIASRLARADQPSLRERLEALVESCEPKLQRNLQHLGLVPKIVRARNEIAHVGTAESLEGSELHKAFNLLVMLMNSTLLRELGYTDSQIEERIWRSPEAHIFLYSF